nr:hypothetical protein [Tanacetum cinerariifolium]
MMGKISFFLGLQISQSPRCVFINQLKYALESFKKYGFDSCDLVDTPMVEKFKLDKDKAVDPSHYHGMIGTLFYLIASRLDLQFAFVDADYAGCQDTRHSTSGSMQFLGDRLSSGCDHNLLIMALDSKRFQCTMIAKSPLPYAATMFNIPERFYTSARNPVKEILLKLNVPDHRILKDGGEVLKLKNSKKDALSKLFKLSNQERYEYVGPKVTSAQDGKDYKMVKRDYAWLMISRPKLGKKGHEEPMLSPSWPPPRGESEGSDDELKKINALLAKAFNQRKFYSKPTNNNLRTSSTTSSANKKQEYVQYDDKKEEKKVDEKKSDMSKVKCYNCKKEGHFTKDCKKAKVLSESEESSSSKEETIAELVLIFCPKVEMSRDVLTVCSTMRILLLYRGEYSQWVEREAMINSIKNGDQPLPRVTQVSIAGTTSTELPHLKDKSMCNKTAKDLWDARARHMLGSEYGEQDRKAAILYEYETFKAFEGELLLDTYIRYLQVINDLKKCGYSKDNSGVGARAHGAVREVVLVLFRC